jgi:hyperosmotically inducible periplasmic protein
MKSLTLTLICAAALAFPVVAQKAEPDNSSKNQRDRSGETQTSGDQANSKEDIDITAAIRRAIVKDGSLSSSAKNIKIITAGKSVTLRGPVKTAEEKTKIQQVVKSAAPGTKINNQLEVKAAR